MCDLLRVDSVGVLCVLRYGCIFGWGDLLERRGEKKEEQKMVTSPVCPRMGLPCTAALYFCICRTLVEMPAVIYSPFFSLYLPPLSLSIYIIAAGKRRMHRYTNANEGIGGDNGRCAIVRVRVRVEKYGF